MNYRKYFLIPAPIAWLLFSAWMMAIWYFSSLSGEQLQVMPLSNLLQWDKFTHGVAFAGGAFLLVLALHATVPQWTRTRLVLLTLLGIALCGAIDEFHQLFTPGRSGADLFDWIADILGASVAMSVYFFGYDRIHGTLPPDQPPAS